MQAPDGNAQPVDAEDELPPFNWAEDPNLYTSDGQLDITSSNLQKIATVKALLRFLTAVDTNEDDPYFRAIKAVMKDQLQTSARLIRDVAADILACPWNCLEVQDGLDMNGVFKFLRANMGELETNERPRRFIQFTTEMMSEADIRLKGEMRAAHRSGVYKFMKEAYADLRVHALNEFYEFSYEIGCAFDNSHNIQINQGVNVLTCGHAVCGVCVRQHNGLRRSESGLLWVKCKVCGFNSMTLMTTTKVHLFEIMNTCAPTGPFTAACIGDRRTGIAQLLDKVQPQTMQCLPCAPPPPERSGPMRTGKCKRAHFHPYRPPEQ